MKLFSVHKRSLTALLLFSVFIGVSCKDETKPAAQTPDTVKPQIVVIRPGNDSKVASGSDLMLEMRFTDDRELGEARITLHFDDGHSHKAVPIDTFFNVPLSGREQVITRTIRMTPEMAAGPHHLLIECVDRSNNKADFVEVDLELTSPLQPAILSVAMNGEGVSESEEFDVHFDGKNELKFNLTGTISAAANGTLEEAEIKIYESPEGFHKTSGFSFERSVPANNMKAVTLNENITLPAADFEAGEHDYYLYIKAKDQSGHAKVFEGKLHVKR